MTSPDLAIASPTYPEQLAAAAELSQPRQRPDRKTLTTALLDAERANKREHQQFLPEALWGDWRLQFTAPKKPRYQAGEPTSRGFYIPGMVAATIGFERHGDSHELTIRNQLQIGPFGLRFTGPAKWLDRRNLLAFDFVQLEVWLGDWRLLSMPVRRGRTETENFQNVPIARLPFFAFFAATEQYIAARGRSGGLALWVKQN